VPTPLTVTASRAVPVEPERAFSLVLNVPLPELFSRRFALIPPIREVRHQVGEWGHVGQVRTIVSADGGSMREELVEVDPPNRFRYLISDLKGPLAPLAERIEGEWTFDSAGTGTRVSWTWIIHPKTALASRALPVLGRMWRGYARQALERVEQILLA
jgi:Polyketide cyclase / dehydrase and lipid transport